MTVSRTSYLTRPLVSLSAWATWRFYAVDNQLTTTLYQQIPNAFDVRTVVAFVLEAHAARDKDLSRTFLNVPGEHLARPFVQYRTPVGSLTPPADPTAAAMWQFWPELMTEQEILSNFRLARTRWRKPTAGHVWSVYQTPSGDLDGAFVTHDHKGVPDPLFAADRRPFAALEAALTVSDRMAEFMENF